MRGEDGGLTRSALLKAGGAAAVSFGVPAVARAAGGAKDPLFYLREATYTPHLNSTFRLDHPHGPITVELVEITNLVRPNKRRRKAAAGEEAFSLLFETTKGEPILQGNYTLHHGKIGSFPLFLVPVGRGVRGHFVEGLVNRMKS